MNLVVGLGNPGEDYGLTRHDIGIMVIHCLARIRVINVIKRASVNWYGEGSFNNPKVILPKPQKFMNCSGNAVKKL